MRGIVCFTATLLMSSSAGAQVRGERRAKERFQQVRRSLKSDYSTSQGGGAGALAMNMAMTTPSPAETAVAPVSAPPVATSVPQTAAPVTASPIVVQTAPPVTKAPVVVQAASPVATAPTVVQTAAPITVASAPVVQSPSPVTASPVVPPTPAPMISFTQEDSSNGRTFRPTPPQHDTGRSCPTGDLSWQELADESPFLQSCKVDSDCYDYYPQDGPACCSYPFCVCATIFNNYEAEFKCVGFDDDTEDA